MSTRRDFLSSALIPIFPSGAPASSQVPQVGDWVRIETLPAPTSDKDWNGWQFFFRKSLRKTCRVHRVNLDDSVSLDVSAHIPPGYRVWEDGEPQVHVEEWTLEPVNIVVEPRHLRLISRGDDHDLPPWSKQYQNSIDERRTKILAGDPLPGFVGEADPWIRERSMREWANVRTGTRITYGFV